MSPSLPEKQCLALWDFCIRQNKDLLNLATTTLTLLSPSSREPKTKKENFTTHLYYWTTSLGMLRVSCRTVALMVLGQFSPQISENWPRTIRATVPQLAESESTTWWFTKKCNFFQLQMNFREALVAQWVRSLDLTAHISLSPIRRGLVPSLVNYKKGALNLSPQVIKFTSCLPRPVVLSGFLQH